MFERRERRITGAARGYGTESIIMEEERRLFHRGRGNGIRVHLFLAIIREDNMDTDDMFIELYLVSYGAINYRPYMGIKNRIFSEWMLVSLL